MHMSDALLSPVVGGVMTAAGAAAIAWSAKKTAKSGLGDQKVPMMGVMGAFVFAAQMINFTIPGTGSSGHIGGGILLAAVLGPFPALLTLASVLLIQCLFFADGGLLAYGCNVFNIGVCACLIAYTFIYRPLTRNTMTKPKIILGSVLAVVGGLQLGAFCVVLETLLSGVAELPFAAFAALMQPIHLAIGLVEGAVTAAVLCFIHAARPSILAGADVEAGQKGMKTKTLAGVFLALALVIGGAVSLFASANPDGLEWAIEKAQTGEIDRSGGVHRAAEEITGKTAILPDYNTSENGGAAGTAAAGLVGSFITVAVAGGTGFIIKLSRKKRGASETK